MFLIICYCFLSLLLLSLLSFDTISSIPECQVTSCYFLVYSFFPCFHELWPFIFYFVFCAILFIYLLHLLCFLFFLIGHLLGSIKFSHLSKLLLFFPSPSCLFFSSVNLAVTLCHRSLKGRTGCYRNRNFYLEPFFDLT